MLVLWPLVGCSTPTTPVGVSPLHVQTWQKRVAANAAKRVALLGSNTTQANMTSKLQLASNIADAEVAAADQAWWGIGSTELWEVGAEISSEVEVWAAKQQPIAFDALVGLLQQIGQAWLVVVGGTDFSNV